MTRPTSDTLMAWAAVGSRISGFHHDSASKLQSLMMALDEATELLGDDRPDVSAAIATATAAMRDIHALLTENRALAKVPVRKSTSVADLVTRAATRYGTKVRGELGAATAHVAAPSLVQALGLLCDQLAGPLQSSRTVDVTVTVGDVVTLELAGAAPTSDDAIAVATFLITREDGSVERTPTGFCVRLPPAPKP